MMSISEQNSQKISSAHAEHRHLFDAAFEGLLIHIDYQVQDVNQAFTKITGYTRDEAIQMFAYQFITKDSRLHAQQQYQTGSESTYKATGLHKDGRTFPIEVRGKNIEYQGQPARIVAVRDISQHHQAQAILQKYNTRLEVLHHIDQAILSAQTPIDIANITFQHLQRLIPHQRTNVALYHAKANEFVILTTTADDVSIAPKQRFPVQHQESKDLLARDQSIIVDKITEEARKIDLNNWLYNQGIRSYLFTPLIYQNTLLGSLNLLSTHTHAFHPEQIEIAREVADQLAIAIQYSRLREDSQRRMKELAGLHEVSQAFGTMTDSRETFGSLAARLAQLIGAQICVVMLYDQKQDQFQAQAPGYGVPDAVLLTYSYSASEAAKLWNFRKHGPFIANSRDEIPALFQELAAAAQVETLLAVPMWVERHLVGQVVAAKKSTGFSEDDAQLLGVLANQAGAVIQNAHLYNNLQRVLQQEQATRTQLIQAGKLTAMGRLVASVAHELNNPLQVIQNVLYLVNQENELPEQAKQDLDLALSESRRMAGLINRLREAYRPTTKESLRAEGLNTLVREVQPLITTHLRQKKVTFTFQPAYRLPQVWGLRDQLKQVILNLILNGVEAMPQGGRLTLETGEQGDEVFMRVADTGMGIPSEDLANVFDPFFTTKALGTGLGLAITYDIIQRHNGRIDVESVVGQGTTFTVWLPSMAQ